MNTKDLQEYQEVLGFTDGQIIEQQKIIANKLLSKLEIIDPFCILAGGAPRDWWLGKPCNDLDFYIHIPHAQGWADKLRFQGLGLTVSRLGHNTKGLGHYGSMQDLFRVYEGVYLGMKYQIMLMNKPTFESVIHRFGTSVCMAWYKDGHICYNDSFLHSHLTKTLYVKDDYNAKELHVEKMKNYFPDYKMFRFSDYNSKQSNEMYMHILCQHPQNLMEAITLLEGETPDE